MPKKALWVQIRDAKTKPAPKTRKRIPTRSARTRRKMWAYKALRESFLKTHRQCVVFPHLPATEIHHSRGRLGTLLIDSRFWRPVSRAGHIWIDAHRGLAMMHSLICARGDWNSAPADAQTKHLKELLR